jgi:type III restriction enzyme
LPELLAKATKQRLTEAEAWALVERLRDGIVPDDSEGEAPLMPIANRYKPIGSTAEVDFKTTRPSYATMKSHIDQVVPDNLVWESSSAFRLESSDAVQFYARNDHMGPTIPYEHDGNNHSNVSIASRGGRRGTAACDYHGLPDQQD